ncbi:MAG: DUF3035 domain-containing protein [Pseudomonadota bacterium]
MRSVPKLSICVLAVVMAAGCTVGSGQGQGIGASLGLSKTSPDEFLVIANRPLQLPPSFTLPVPTPGVASRVELDPLSDAHRALFNRPQPLRLNTASIGESVLLTGADADGDNAVIRQVLAQEDPSAGERQFGLTSIFGIPIPATLDDRDALLESQEENERLRSEGFLTPTAPPIAQDDE